MTTFYMPGGKNNKGHTCDYCEKADGRPTLYWEKKDFDLCYECVEKLANEYLNYEKLSSVKISRIIIPEKFRNEIFKRDHYKCVKCGSLTDLCIDHIKPFSKGGETIESNLQTLCRKCNLKKSNK